MTRNPAPCFSGPRFRAQPSTAGGKGNPWEGRREPGDLACGGKACGPVELPTEEDKEGPRGLECD